MPYYPKSQIKTNLYTEGGKYTLDPSTDTPYIGYFYETSTGQKFTGKTPEDGPNLSLFPQRISPNLPPPSSQPNSLPETADAISLLNSAPPDKPYPNTIDTKTYNILVNNNNSFQERELPQYSPPIITTEDYSKGFTYRFFAKRRNELKFIEINKSTYDKFSTNSPGTAFDLYSVISIKWALTGDVNSIYKQNKSMVELKTKQQKWYGFVEYFKDNFTKYSK